MAFCSACGSPIPEGSNVCPACNRSATLGGVQPATAGSGLADNVAGMLAYVTFIPAIILLVTAPYNTNRFVRFHSFQSIFFCIAWVAVWMILHFVLVLVPFMLLIWPLVSLAFFVIWIVLVLKANQMQMYKLPVIGDLAEKQANT